MFTAAMLEEQNNRMIFLWEINFILMQIRFIVWLLQHGRREHTLFVKYLRIFTNMQQNLPFTRGVHWI